VVDDLVEVGPLAEEAALADPRAAIPAITIMHETTRTEARIERFIQVGLPIRSIPINS